MAHQGRLKKAVELRQSGLDLRFEVSQELFSSHDVDLGSRFLLRTVMGDEHRHRRRVLDLGCGYGPLGIALAAAVPDRMVHMVDRDALAVDYAGRNAELNGVGSATIAYGSLGFDDVDEDGFDLIVSNIPGKAGEPVIRHMLMDARFHVAADAVVAVVVVLPLAEFVRDALTSSESVELLYERSTKRYTVFHYGFAVDRTEKPQAGFERGLYRRGIHSFQHGTTAWEAETVVGLPEFDTLGFHSELAMDLVGQLPRPDHGRVEILNPGQGHVAAFVVATGRAEHIALVGRDLLALRNSRSNLIREKTRTRSVGVRHSAELEASGDDSGVDLAVLLYPEIEPTDAVTGDILNAASRLRANGSIVVSSRSALTARIVDGLASSGSPVSTVRKASKKGHTALLLRS